MAAGNAVGMVWLRAEHAAVGYMSHPAVVDSSMHLSVFSSGSNGQTRVPGLLQHPAAPSHHGTYSVQLVLDAANFKEFKLENNAAWVVYWHSLEEL